MIHDYSFKINGVLLLGHLIYMYGSDFLVIHEYILRKKLFFYFDILTIIDSQLILFTKIY